MVESPAPAGRASGRWFGRMKHCGAAPAAPRSLLGPSCATLHVGKLGSLSLCGLATTKSTSVEFMDRHSCTTRCLWKAKRRDKPPGEPRRRKEWTPARQGLVLGSWKGHKAPGQHLASFTRFYQPGKPRRPPSPASRLRLLTAGLTGIDLNPGYFLICRDVGFSVNLIKFWVIHVMHTLHTTYMYHVQWNSLCSRHSPDALPA